ncbi:MAG: DUF4280 domain-containing protein [Candidatus Aminicenantes bacterium]|nr:DUF4280 domain-containing protein [Candidatus Aminicenantes bacterium]
MALAVCNGATLQCSFGVAPGTLTVLPDKMVMTTSQPMATIMDNKPMVNIAPFGMCTSIANPAVAAAMSPQPCIPVTTAPWVPGAPTVLVSNMPALDNSSKLLCQWAGMIQVVVPGQVKTQVP